MVRKDQILFNQRDMKRNRPICSFYSLLIGALFISGCDIFNSNQPFSGGKGTEANPYVILTIEQLQAIDDPEYLDKHFVQAKDIDAAASADFENPEAYMDQTGFSAIGDHEHPFTGSYNGNGFVIRNLHLAYVPTNILKGLFGYVKNGRIENITIDNGVNIDIDEQMGLQKTEQNSAMNQPQSLKNVMELHGDDYADVKMQAGLVAINDGGYINNCHFIGNVNGYRLQMAAGFVGVNSGIIERSSFEGNANGIGFVNWNLGQIRRSHVSARPGFQSGYGMVVRNDGLISESSVEIDIHSTFLTTGLAGKNNGTIESSYVTGNLHGTYSTVGIVDENSGEIKNSYVIVNMDVDHFDGIEYQTFGFIVNENQSTGLIENVFAAGTLQVDPNAQIITSGGVAATNNGHFSSVFWDREKTGVTTGVGNGSSEGTAGLTTEQMTGDAARENMPGFDWGNVWTTSPDGYPILHWQLEE
jgi:hypothetical protein